MEKIKTTVIKTYMKQPTHPPTHTHAHLNFISENLIYLKKNKTLNVNEIISIFMKKKSRFFFICLFKFFGVYLFIYFSKRKQNCLTTKMETAMINKKNRDS